MSATIGSLSFSQYPPSYVVAKIIQYYKKQRHDKSNYFQLSNKTLIVQSPGKEDDDSPLDFFVEDTIY